jgi:hypothetical protein
MRTCASPTAPSVAPPSATPASASAVAPRGAKRWGTAERPPYQWAIEGDIKGCFDHIDHHALMERVRRRVGDGKLNRLIVAFLKAGVMSDAQFLRTDSGTPPGFSSPRYRRLMGLGALATALMLACAALAILALGLGWRLAAAGFGLGFVLACPLLLLGPVQDWWRHRRGRRRRHHTRPPGFGDA